MLMETQGPGRLPRFVIIGAAKAATTWIAHQLRVRPDVFLPGPEPHFFSRVYENGIDWYAGLFSAAEQGQLIGEKSADYLADPNVPARMADWLPDAKIIVQLRNPVERAYSDYCMLFRRGQVSGDIERQLHTTHARSSRFLADGLYARHLKRFFDHFAKEQIMILLFEDIRLRPEHVLHEVCSFLGITPQPPRADLTRPLNDSRAALVPPALRALPAPVKRLVAPLRGTTPFEAVRSLLAKPVRYPPLPDELRRQLEIFYDEDVAMLGEMLNRDMSTWRASRQEAR